MKVKDTLPIPIQVTVYCPREEKTITGSICFDCPHFGGIKTTKTAGGIRIFIDCGYVEVEEPEKQELVTLIEKTLDSYREHVLKAFERTLAKALFKGGTEIDPKGLTEEFRRSISIPITTILPLIKIGSESRENKRQNNLRNQGGKK